MNNTHLTVETISLCLYQIDPMKTCCKEHNSNDEYNQVASGVMNRLAKNISLQNAVSYEFLYWFDTALSTSIREEIVQALSLPS